MIDLVAKMTAAVLYGKEDVRIERVAVPEINDDEVLVRIKTALTCGTDVKVFRRGYHARMIVPPAVFGHEFSGIVEKVGKKVAGFWPGQRIVAANSAPCNECFYCKKGKPNLCEDLIFINGAYAEYIKIPQRIVKQNLLHLPDHVSFRSAAMVEPLACVVRGVDESEIRKDDTVVVMGTGPIAFMFIKIAKFLGAKVICVGRREERLKIARILGADILINSSQVDDVVKTVRDQTDKKRGADVAIECIGQPRGWEMAIDMVRKGGTINLFGGCAPHTTITLNTERLHYSELNIKASFHHTPRHIQKALEFITKGVVNPEEFITAEAPLERLPHVLDTLINQRNSNIKVAIIP